MQGIIKEGRRFAVDVDLSKFFDRVDHDLLMTHLIHKVMDKRLLKLISQYLRGWINYFGIANCYQLCVDLDHWIR